MPVLVLLCAFCLAAPSLVFAAATNSFSTAFDDANKLFDQGKYPEAVSAFETLARSGQVSAAVFFNLGNALYKSGQIGRAIAAYRTAHQIAPRDPDVNANLQFARNQAQLPTLLPSRWQRWLGKLTLNEWTLASAAALWAWLLLMAVGQLRTDLKPVLRAVTRSAGVATVAFCALLGAAWQSRSIERAVVVTRNAAVRQGPLGDSQTLFTLHDGAEVRILDRKNEWMQVQVGPRQVGWTRADELSTPR
jgi:tetratricopeptide (TPR) repeat protein